ncbi:MAG: ATP-binding cassette domain-containing protein [Clostridia bacterium]|nr:ATP-binding cassette domain-containing protein [Clostridia bacterium]
MKINNLSKSFDNKCVFNNFSCEFIDNKINFIIGESGSGKTTLLRIIAGLDKDFQGAIEGNNGEISIVFQEPRLIPYINVLENVNIVNQNSTIKTTTELLKIFELENELYNMPNSLSGGMKMRVAIARALNYDSDLVLMDEPFSALDEELKARILPKIFEKLSNKTVIIVSHNEIDCQQYADNIINLNENILKD